MIESDKKIKLLSYLIAALFLYNSFGYVLLYYPAQTIIKYIVQKSIHEKKINLEDISVLAFRISDLEKNKYDFIWEKPEKEFRFNGKMYDIEDEVIIGDTVYYKVYYDHNENILEGLFSLQQQDTKKDKTQSSVQRVLLVGLYFEQLEYFSINLNNLAPSNLSFNKNQTDFLNYTPDIPTPPPRLIV